MALADLEVYESLEEFLDKYGDQDISVHNFKAEGVLCRCNLYRKLFYVISRETSGLPAIMHERYTSNAIKIPMRTMKRQGR